MSGCINVFEVLVNLLSDVYHFVTKIKVDFKLLGYREDDVGFL